MLYVLFIHVIGLLASTAAYTAFGGCCCAMLCFIEIVDCSGTAAGESETAPGARRWLARSATSVKALSASTDHTTAAACTSLVTYLPALERVHLQLSRPMVQNGLGHLLEALASCPRLEGLGLCLDYVGGLHRSSMLHSLAPFAQLCSLRQLSLNFYDMAFYPLADVVRALVPLTGLAELTICCLQDAVVPAALGQLKALRSLTFTGLMACVLEAGCFDLPKLLTLDFRCCIIEDAEVLKSIPALLSLTRIECLGGYGPPFAAQLIQLPQLRRMVLETIGPCGADYSDAYLGLPWLPSYMSHNVLHLSLAGHGLAQFPLVLTQLVALEHLDARGNDFADPPTAVTALSRLTELVLGRMPTLEPWEPDEPLDVRALGDLSAFPALCKLYIHACEVALPGSVLGVTWHASLTELWFYDVRFTLESAPLVRQLRQALEQMGRGSVLDF